MHKDHIEILCRIRGTLDRLYTLPTDDAMSHEERRNIDRWQTAYHMAGLTFARSTDDAIALRNLTEAGYLSGTGKTKGSIHRLTVKGLFTTCEADETPVKELRDTLARLATMEDESSFTMPGTTIKIIPGFDPCPTAGRFWSCRNDDAAWEKYLAEFHAIDRTILPLIIAGWVRRYISTTGIQWAVCLTPEGRTVLSNWPNVKAEPMTHNSAAWLSGWNSAAGYKKATPPPATGSILTRRLPDSEWRCKN